MESDRLPTPKNAADRALLKDLDQLFDEADAIWERSQDEPEFRSYVSADYRLICRSLMRLRGKAVTFLEWGSGLGVVTMMASRLGFEAYGIEIESLLVEHSRQLAQRFAPQAHFATGSFIPDEFQWLPEEDDVPERTTFDTPAAYGELDLELRDFDLVYAYPWPEEHALYRNIMRRCGGRHALFLSYDAREGVALNRRRRR